MVSRSFACQLVLLAAGSAMGVLLIVGDLGSVITTTGAQVGATTHGQQRAVVHDAPPELGGVGRGNASMAEPLGYYYADDSTEQVGNNKDTVEAEAEVEAQVGASPKRAADNLHMVYQLACGAFSLHQAIALDWSWREVKQPGRLTRLVCGCPDTGREKERLSASPLEGDPRFSVLFSEEWNDYVPRVFPRARGDNYKIYNKVWAMKDWLDRALPEEEYVAFLDPDMVFTRPLMHHVPPEEGGRLPTATQGHPVGQFYQYVRPYCPEPCRAGDPGWAEFAIPDVCGDQCPQVPQRVQGFAVGPPLIMHREDWRRLAPLWCNYTVEVRARATQKSNANAWVGGKGAKTYIAEMLAYALVAATLRMPHAEVSIVTDAMDGLAYPCMEPGAAPGRQDPAGRGGGGAGPACSERPALVHYCYPQNTPTPFGHWIWNKYRMPVAYGSKGEAQWSQPLFWDCDMPLLEEPPAESAAGAAAEAAWKRAANGNSRQRHVLWMIWEIIRAYNGGVAEVKQRRCAEKEIEERKIMRVDENTWYVPESNLLDESGRRPLALRLRSNVRKT